MCEYILKVDSKSVSRESILKGNNMCKVGLTLISNHEIM